MACVNCFDNCGDRYTTDRCVEYTGEDVALLGICKGDTLYQIEQIVLEKLLVLMDGTGITFDDLTLDCDFIKDIISGQDVNLATLIQTMVVANCTLRDLITELDTKVNAPFTLDASCLTLPASPTKDDILKAAVAKICEIEGKTTEIFSDYVKASELCDKVQDCLTTINNGGGDTIVQEYTKMPKNVVVAYIGSLAVFDSSGAGLASQGYDKVYICNGNNGTPDLRGYAIIGANVNVVGPSLDAAVDPSQPNNAQYQFSTGTKKGEYSHTNTIQETAAHSHSATVPDHTHFSVGVGNDTTLTSGTSIINAHSSGGNLGYGLSGSSSTASIGKTSPASLAITVGSAGGNQPHNNVQPSYAAVYIVYLP